MIGFSIDDILGQETALQYINSYVKSPEKIPPLLIFHGPVGVGKWSLAERFSMQVLCMKGTACGTCDSCKLFLSNQHPDYIVFPVNSRVAIGDEKDPADFTIRWLLARRLNYKPHLSTRRIILFPDATLINNEAESALLKSLEEPPEHSRFIFIVDDLQKLKQTIISRGICIPFYYLKRNIAQQISEANNLYREDFFGGSLSPFDAPSEVVALTRKKIENTVNDPILLLELENWVKTYKDEHPEWPEDFNYIEFLEMFCTIMIYVYNKNDQEKNLERLEALFEFKRELHKNIPNLENFILSRLFFKLGKGKV